MRVKISVKALVAVAAVTCSTLSGCASAKRFGTDVAVVVTSPVTIVLSSVHDSLDWGPDSGTAAPIALAPFNIPAHMLKHCAYTIVYGVDLCLSPIYLLSNITPQNHDDLGPIELYSLGDGYPWKNSPWPEFED